MAWGFQHCFAQPRREMFNESREYSLMLSDGGGPAAGQQVSERQGGGSSTRPDWYDLFSILVALFSETSGGSQGQAGRQNHFSAWSPSAGSERGSGSGAVRQKMQKLHPHTHAPQQATGPASPHPCSTAGSLGQHHTHRETCRGTRGRPETRETWHDAPPTRGWTVENIHANKSLYKEC